MNNFFKLAILIALLVLGGMNLTAQEELHTIEWLYDVIEQDDYEQQLLVAFSQARENGWAHEGQGGVTVAIPANSVVLAEKNAGNHPAFEEIADDVWYTGEGGRFGANSYFRAFQLIGDTVAASGNINDVIEAVINEPEYAKQIEMLDLLWSSDSNVLNRWGSSGPRELLTEEQLELLVEHDMDLQPIEQQLPGNVIIWGELYVPEDGAIHWGLARLDENIYVTTCLGGLFTTVAGYRAVQLEAPALDALIPDADGCLGAYSEFDQDDIRSIPPLSD